MTRLACFYNRLDPRCKAALEKYAPGHGLHVEWVDTSASQQAYAAELAARWDGTEDLILVEQDKEIHAACLPELLGCGEPWCAYGYWMCPDPHTSWCLGGFGVTRFTAAIQRLVPVEAFAGPEWAGIDRRFYDLLREEHGIGCHLHGHVVHHHVYQPRPASVRERVAALRAQGLLPPAAYPQPAAPHLLPGSYDLSG